MKKIPILCNLPLAFYFGMWYYNSVKGRGKNPRTASVDSRGCEKLEKKCKKPLDNPHKVWYNVNVINGRKTLKTRKELIL